jgi:hypothetical protein
MLPHKLCYPERLAAAVCAIFIAGCATSTALPAATVTTSVSTTLQATGGTLTYPAGGGYTATFAYGSNNAASGVVATVTTIANAPASLIPMDPPRGTMLIAYELLLNQNVTFTVWNGFISSVVLPQSIQPSGHAFSDYGYDLALDVASGSDLGTVSGSIVTFPAGRFAVTLLANHTYLMVLAMQ